MLRLVTISETGNPVFVLLNWSIFSSELLFLFYFDIHFGVVYIFHLLDKRRFTKHCKYSQSG